jgi:hypothetical protein
MKTIEGCAAHYANQWANLDRPLFEGLRQGHTEQQRLATLGSLCSKYKIARSLRRAYDVDVGLPRYQPLLKLVDRCKKRCPAPSSPNEVVLWFRDELSAHYGGVRALSLSSKVLWFVYRSPVIIYDKYVQVALETPAGDYRSYQERWIERFKDLKKEVAFASTQYSGQRWFHERVFDIHLWHIGQMKIEQRVPTDRPASTLLWRAGG